MTTPQKRPRTGGRPSHDRVMISFYITRSGREAVEKLAVSIAWTKADTYRALLRIGLEQVQKHPTLLKAKAT